jgi:hypothetical protein
MGRDSKAEEITVAAAIFNLPCTMWPPGAYTGVGVREFINNNVFESAISLGRVFTSVFQAKLAIGLSDNPVALAGRSSSFGGSRSSLRHGCTR